MKIRQPRRPRRPRPRRRRRRVAEAPTGLRPDSAVYDEWDAFVDFAATVTAATGPLVEADLGARYPRLARCSPSASTTAAMPRSRHGRPRGPGHLHEVPGRARSGPSMTSRSSASSVDWEVELVAVVGRRADRVAEADAWSHIAGLTVGQDISDRALQFAAGAQFSLGKSAAGTGPWGRGSSLPTRCPTPTTSRSVARSTARRSRTPAPATSSSAFRGWSPSSPRCSRCCPATSSSPARRPGSASPASLRASLQPGNVLETWIEGVGTIRNRVGVSTPVRAGGASSPRRGGPGGRRPSRRCSRWSAPRPGRRGPRTGRSCGRSSRRRPPRDGRVSSVTKPLTVGTVRATLTSVPAGE